MLTAFCVWKTTGDFAMNDLVSIVMPSYNTAPYIKDSINSVLQQSYTNWELLIVDDCSTDNTVDIIKDFHDARISLFQNEKNSGAAISRNYALRKAKGKWIAFLDSDDMWKPEKLEKQLEFMEKNRYDFSYTKYEVVDFNGETTGKMLSGPKKITKRGMYRYCWPGCLTVMYNAEKAGMIQVENIKRHNDYAMWIQVSKKATCYLLPDVLSCYRKRNNSITSQNYFNLIKWHYRLFRNAEKELLPVALWHTFVNIIFGLAKKIIYVNKVKN